MILTRGSAIGEGEHTLQKNTTIQVQALDDGRIPVFTSTERIFDKGVIKEKVPFLVAKGADVLSFTKGATLILNPYSDYGKELLPDEIEELLSGTIFHSMTRTINVREETSVQIGQPAVYPTEIVDSLKKLFANEPNVNAAYLAWIHNAESGEPPHCIVGIDAQEYSTIVAKAGSTARMHFKKGEFVDFIQMGNTPGVVSYLKSTVPFYQK